MRLIFCILFIFKAYASPDVIDGKIVARGSYEAVVKLLHHDNKGKAIGLCTGTLISKRTILTAAHCVVMLKNNEFTYFKPEVTIESRNQKVLIKRESIQNIIVPKESILGLDINGEIAFNPSHDLALITLDKNIKGLGQIKFPKMNLRSNIKTLHDPSSFESGMNPWLLNLAEFKDFKIVGYGAHYVVKDNYTLYKKKFDQWFGIDFNKSKKRSAKIRLLPKSYFNDEAPLLSIGTNLHRKKNSVYSEVFKGDSGGPLFSSDGDLVGVITMEAHSLTKKSSMLFGKYNAIEDLRSIFVHLGNPKNKKFIQSYMIK